MGLTYEHSPSEGQPIAVMTDYLIDYMWVLNIIKLKYNHSFFFRKINKGKDLPDTKLDQYPKKLQFNVNKAIDDYIQLSSRNIDK